MEADNRNRQLLDRLESLWLESGKLSPAPVAVDIDAAWNRLNVRVNDFEKNQVSFAPRNGPGKIIPLRYFWALAASIIVIAGIFGIYRITSSPEMIQMAARENVLVDSLPDGTSVALNTNSTLTYPDVFDDHERKVKLTGEAFFKVKRDALKPFLIDAGLAGIRVLGTAFRVKADPGKAVEVDVKEGRVMLFRIDVRTGDTASVILSDGESGIFREGMLKPEKTGSVSPDGLFWANRSLDFRRTSLSEVFSLLEKHHQVRISVSDPSILKCRLTASFIGDPPDRIMTVIAESFGLKLDVNGQDFLFTGIGCNDEAN
jgi:ferric-dicitrate binding protein FerR (iron transport regulator)